MLYPQFIHTGFGEGIVAHPEESGKQKKIIRELADGAHEIRKLAE
jgi:hypothetical protein